MNHGLVSATNVSRSTPYDDSIVAPPLGASNAQDALDALKNLVAISASPGFTWGRSGAVNVNTWFLNDSVPSNISGRTVFLFNAEITKIFVANKNATANLTVEVYSHDGDSVNLTLLGTVVTAAQRSNTFTVSYPIALNKQIAMKLAPNTAGTNMVIGCLIKGTLV